jgi:hypothetical protein
MSDPTAVPPLIGSGALANALRNINPEVRPIVPYLIDAGIPPSCLVYPLRAPVAHVVKREILIVFQFGGPFNMPQYVSVSLEDYING